MTKRQSTLVGLGIVFTLIIAVVALMATKPQPPKKPSKVTAPIVQVVEPSVESHRFLIDSYGVVQPRTETTLVSEVSGIIESVSDKFYAGGYFDKGEVLLQIDPTDYQVAVEQALARLASAEAQLAQEQARSEQAQKEWDLSGRSRNKAPALALREPFLLEAKANVQSARADLKQAEQKLSRTTIRAPYQGMVKAKQADIGQFVSMGTPLGTTFATDYAEVRLPLTDEDLGFIKAPDWNSNTDDLATPVALSANYAGETYTWYGEVVRMEGVVDERSRVHYAVARVNDPYAITSSQTRYPLKVGTFVTANISGLEIADTIKIPREAFRDLNKVVVADSNRELQIRELEIIRAEADFVYVSSGLQAGDQIVMTSLESPVQGMKLRIEGESEVVDDEEKALVEEKLTTKEESSVQARP